MNSLRILPIPLNVWPKGPEDIFLAYVYKSITLVNELKRHKC